MTLFLRTKVDLARNCRITSTTIIPKASPKFLYKQLCQNNTEFPSWGAHLRIDGKIHAFFSAIVTFHAPSDISGISSMWREHIRATSSWKRGQARYDTVLVNTNPKDGGVHGGVRGFEVAHVFFPFSFWYDNKEYPCALTKWYSHVGFKPDVDTGLWMVEPDTDDSGDPCLAIIHLDSIYIKLFISCWRIKIVHLSTTQLPCIHCSICFNSFTTTNFQTINHLRFFGNNSSLLMTWT